MTSLISVPFVRRLGHLPDNREPARSSSITNPEEDISPLLARRQPGRQRPRVAALVLPVNGAQD